MKYLGITLFLSVNFAAEKGPLSLSGSGLVVLSSAEFHSALVENAHLVYV